MESSGRAGKSIKNIAYALCSQVLSLLLGFVSRAVFLRYLSEAYLGVNTLFSEIISMLSIADIGLTSVMLFSFFEPLAVHDEGKLSSLIHFYKRIYNGIALAVGVLGVCLIPFLKYLVNLDQNMDYLYLYYLMFLSKTVVSYLFVYKQTLLFADQKNYIVTKITMYTHFFCAIVQIFLLVNTHNYFLYLTVDIIFVFLQNFLCAYKADQLYPFLVQGSSDKLRKEEKEKILHNIKDGFIYKISGVLLNSTDNTLISILIGTIAVGKFNNYSMITTKIVAVGSVVFSNLTGSLGNLIVLETEARRREIFYMMQTICNFLCGIIITCIFLLINDFVKIWIGGQYILRYDVIIALLMNVYFSIALLPMWAFRDATALFRKTKYVMLICALLNIILSVILGKWIGLAGIIAASAISRLCTYFWYEPLVLYRQYFGKTPGEYYRAHFLNVITISLVSGILYYAWSGWKVSSWIMIFCKAVLVGITVIAAYLIFFCRRKDFQVTFEYIKNRLTKTTH